MIKEICNALKERLIEGVPLKLVDTISGMVQTVTYKDLDENENPITKRFPVSYDTNMQICGRGPEMDLVPDSSKKGLVYFEESGSFQKIKDLSGGRSMQRGNVLLVCWMNRRKSVGDSYKEVSKLGYDEIMKKLSGVIPSDLFLNLRVTSARFRQDSSVFTRYTYEETVLQYLRPPFEYFAIDLTISFITTCSPEIILDSKQC